MSISVILWGESFFTDFTDFTDFEVANPLIYLTSEKTCPGAHFNN